MFGLTTIAYPALLGVLCAGAGLVVDRCAGGWLAGALLLPLGAAALIALTQLSTYVSALAPASPYLALALALAGLALGRARLRTLWGGGRAWRWPLLATAAGYLLAIAPVLFSGRASFSSFMALSDSAVHMLGADFLIDHGQDYGHLDLRNSYGQFIHNYYGSSYPSGADTMFGASASLLGAPLIWAFQPFNAFMLAASTGPLWLLARRLRLPAGWAALAALLATVPALAYGYELLGSIKEITALCMILTLGALAAGHEQWLARPPRAAIPFAVAVAAGVSALGVGFGVWALAASLALLAALLARRPGAAGVRGAAALLAAGALVLLLGALPTWTQLSGSLHVAQSIASTGNPGNLHAPLHVSQLLGVWLRGSYKQSPTGASLVVTDVLIGVTLAAALLGALQVLRTRQLALGAWFALTLLALLVLSVSATTWVRAKTLMLTSPAVVLLAWGGLATLLGASPSRRRRLAGVAVALALSGGVLVSDFEQYHASNLAPTARYEELSSLNRRFAGRGPALLTDFDEYALYVLRDLDVGGPDFVYPPPALASLAGGYGRPVQLDRAAPAALLGYPLIVTRRDPSASPPPAAYALAWQGTSYLVWVRRPHAAAAIAHLPVPGSAPGRCAALGRLAGAAASGARLIAARAPQLVSIALARSSHPARWGHQRGGLVMSRPGTLSARFLVPAAGRWLVWLQGQIMPAVTVRVDGRRLGSLAGALGGNSLVPDTAPPLSVRLSAGAHRITLSREGFSLAPGNGGSAVLDALFLTPAGVSARETLSLRAQDWRPLCSGQYAWVELLSRSP